ncbi:adenylate/guanylate cyclase domain-containing protein [Pelagibius marinus]|uniref:adenylate/guanylate cyclase domain-containing protein n=1 Tax=Pelagibius marinus TaxID=2762760 RepID=UPI00187290F2|nr:adenylate/guanylate cyclase domain-containing protein [Pelagibius marinus]
MEHRLAAILAADMVGYSRLMAADESETIARQKDLRDALIDPRIARYGGRIVKTTGDGLLVEFASVLDAVQCAVELQLALQDHESTVGEERRIRYRIGINLGDIVIDGDDILGDGVNIAARLEGIAEPGGLCLSDVVYQNVANRLEASFRDLGEQHLKNMSRPVRVWSWLSEAAGAAGPAAAPHEPLQLPDRPSIAVLPFDNMSGDPDQDYFADGMVEEIITALSRMRWLFVIARNSSFTYKGRAVNVKQVGEELGVRYVLEGSVRKAGNRVRITGQLIDAASGTHLWADRFDGALEDVFELQDQMTASVVGAIAPRLEQAEIERAKHKPTESLDAYDYYLRGMASVHLWNREANREALELFSKAIELDPDFAAAYGMAARCYSMRKASGWVADAEAEIAETIRMARQAAKLGKDDPVALCTAGVGLAFVAGELEEGAGLIEESLDLDPNQAWAWLFSGWVKVWLGEPEVAIRHLEHAIRFSPHDPHIFAMHSAIASAHFFAGRHAEALACAQRALRANAHLLLAACVVAASAALLGKTEEAQQAMDDLRRLAPTLRLSNLQSLFPIRRPEDFAAWSEALRRAGLAA